MSDPFASPVISLVLAWAFSIPILLGFVAWTFKAILKQEAGRPWALSVWVWLCIVVVSPYRYMVLQVIAATAYVFQSGWAIVSVLLLVWYVPIGSAVLGAIGVYLPLLGYAAIAGTGEPMSKRRLVGACLALPVLCAAGYGLFFAALPYAAWTVRWVSDEDLLRATNGPAHYFYQIIVEPDIARFGPHFQAQLGDSAKDRLRSHVSEVYTSPASRTARHFSLSMRYQQQATVIANSGAAFSVTPPSEIEQMLTLSKAALREAEQADAVLLNARVADLGAVYREKFIAGLRDVIEGLETRKNLTQLRGILLLNEWGDWYTAHLDEIRHGK